MNCCFKKKKKKRTIYPNPDYQPKTQNEFSELFMGEVLSCGVCKKAFTLRENELVAYCGGCYQFLHCGISGKCVGPNCSFMIRGNLYTQTWCVRCVPMKYQINISTPRGPNSDCLCQECADDPSTLSKFKK